VAPGPDEDLLRLLGDERARLLERYDRVPSGMREVPPAPERWSAAEVLEHLALTDATVVRVLRLAAARRGSDSDQAPAHGLSDRQAHVVRDRTRRLEAPARVCPPAGISAQAALDHLREERVGLLSALSKLPAGVLDTAHLPHPAFGDISLRGWIEFLGHHDARHAAQLDAIVSGEAG